MSSRFEQVMIVVTVITIILGFIIVSLADAKHLHTEKWYQELHCNQLDGQMEVVMQDNSRCDCLTDEYAIEHDFGNMKAFEGLSQALLYAMYTGKRAGLALIIEDDKLIYFNRVKKIIKHYALPVDIWLIFNDNDNITIYYYREDICHQQEK